MSDFDDGHGPHPSRAGVFDLEWKTTHLETEGLGKRLLTLAFLALGVL